MVLHAVGHEPRRTHCQPREGWRGAGFSTGKLGDEVGSGWKWEDEVDMRILCVFRRRRS